MKFYCLHEGFYEGVQQRLDELSLACKHQKIDFIAINSLEYDYTNLPILGKTDLLYNAARGSQTLESLLLNKDVTTFYINNPYLNQTYTTTDWSILHDKENINAPKTIYHFTNNRDILKKYLTYLGGFPIIIKEVGGTRGIGTIKVESWQNLISIADYLVKTKGKFILREFIKATHGCRMIVLGDQVIAAAGFVMNKDDFRNAAILDEIKYFKDEFPKSVKQTAVKASHIANTEFSGVDFLFDEQGNYFLLEINFPTGFSGLNQICNLDIALEMVKYLKVKSEKSRL